jgi:hypothetical protein
MISSTRTVAVRVVTVMPVIVAALSFKTVPLKTNLAFSAKALAFVFFAMTSPLADNRRENAQFLKTSLTINPLQPDDYSDALVNS